MKRFGEDNVMRLVVSETERSRIGYIKSRKTVLWFLAPLLLPLSALSQSQNAKDYCFTHPTGAVKTSNGTEMTCSQWYEAGTPSAVADPSGQPDPTKSYAPPPPIPATDVKGHKIGESVAQFLEEAGTPYLLDRCHELPAASEVERARERSDRGYDHALDGTILHKQTKEEREQRKAAQKLGLDLYICSNLVAAANGQRAEMDIVNLLYQATFDGGALIRVDIPELPGGFRDLLQDLEDKYGRPKATTSEELQNAYGATFTVGRAFWQMPDGVQILAAEHVNFESGSGYRRTISVVLATKDEAIRAGVISELNRRAANPFDR
jgi:hypothetical protein